MTSCRMFGSAAFFKVDFRQHLSRYFLTLPSLLFDGAVCDLYCKTPSTSRIEKIKTSVKILKALDALKASNISFVKKDGSSWLPDIGRNAEKD